VPSVLPLWADILIVVATPVILLAVLWKWGGGSPDNSIVHEQDGGQGDGEEDGRFPLAA
jgi:hypothetical protein